MADLRVNLLGKTLNGPVIGASGTFGYGVEYADMIDCSRLGGVCSKGLTLNGKPGNQGERLWETPSGLINSIGLRRRDFTNEKINEIQDIYRILYQSGLNNSDAVERIEAELPASKERDEIILFVRNSKRGIMKGYMGS